MFSLIISILALGFIILFHELGHFLMAKRFGVGVVEFSLGMGPRLWSVIKGETRYSLRALPFGGSCMMVGEDPEENGIPEGDFRQPEKLEVSPAEAAGEEPESAGAAEESEGILLDGRFFPKGKAFTEKPAWQRFCIIAAGPVFNFILALLLSLVITQQAGYDPAVILAAEEGVPAAESGVAEGDTVLSINGDKVTVYRDVQLYLLTHQREMAEGMPISLALRTQEGTEKTAVIQPVYMEDTGSYRMGIYFSAGYRPVESLGELLKYGWYNVEFCVKTTVASLEMLVQGKVQRDDVMGPVRMVATMDDTVAAAASYGLWTTVMSLMDLIVLISASLGAMNLLPLPALDGGQLLFILIEMVRRRPVSPELVGRINMAGMMLLLMLMVLVMFNDFSIILG